MKVLIVSLLTVIGFMPLSLSEMTVSANESFAKSAYVKQKEIAVVDNELESLMNLRDYYTSKVHRYRSRAMRYEFQGDNLEEYKHLSLEADKLDSVIKQIDEEIDRLEKERSALLKN